MKQNKAWNLYQGDGLEAAAAFTLSESEYAIINTHLMCCGDAILILEYDAYDAECDTSFVDLGMDGCNPMILAKGKGETGNPKGRIVGPGVYAVARGTRDGETLAMQAEVKVRTYERKDGDIAIRGNEGFCIKGGC